MNANAIPGEDPEPPRSVCIVGGGPAGMMAGVLLARQGVDVTVLEKHPDFYRDFRGDTLHPSTLEIFQDLGWLDELLDIPHRRMSEVSMTMGDTSLTFADFSRLPVTSPFIAFMPQWDFLELLASKGRRNPHFTLVQGAEVVDVVRDSGRVFGVTCRRADSSEPFTVTADFVIAADGRNSVLRTAAGLTPRASSPPIDVLWFRLPRAPDETVAFFRGGDGALVSIDRGDYWQVAFALPAGSIDALRDAGIGAFRKRVARLQPEFTPQVEEIRSWDDVHLLSVRVDRLPQWTRPGLLFIGDSAHAMSPAGGVGINLAIQDGVAAANMIGPALRAGTDVDEAARRVQRRRSLPARITQLFQLVVLRDLYPRSQGAAVRPPVLLHVFRIVPVLRRLMGRFIGLGVRPEHPDPVRPENPTDRNARTDRNAQSEPNAGNQYVDD